MNRILLLTCISWLIFIEAAGQNVGIGTSDPQRKLEVIGDISLPSSTGNKAIYTWAPADANWRIGMSETPGFSRSLATSHVEYMTFASGAGQGFALGDVVSGLSAFEVTGSGSGYNAYFRGNVGIGINPAYSLHVYNGGNASMKIGQNTTYLENRLFFGDGEFTWIGESAADDRLMLHSFELALEIAGNPGIDGQVLTSNGTTASWVDGDPSAPISDCSIVGTYDLPVVVYYGSYGNENSWELRSSPTPGVGVIASGGAGPNYTTVYNSTVTLNYGQDYYFDAYDSYGDGWNAGGYFNLGSPMNTGNVAVPGYGLTYNFSYQLCSTTSVKQRIVRGSIQGTGDIIGGGGFDLSSFGNGQYEITFIPAFSDRPSATVTQVFSDFDSNGWGGSTLDNAIITHLDANKMRIVTGDGSGVGTDRDFTFIVIGSK